MRIPLIEILNVTKSWGIDNQAIRNVSLSIDQGDFVTIIGPSGCGKTTLLRLINGMTDYDSGKIRVFDNDISEWDKVKLRRRIGYVIQSGALFPHLTVRQNIQFVMNIAGSEKELQEKRVSELALIMGFSNSQLEEYPENLSGGQQQRVGVARALALNPEIILMDEPFGALDNITRKNLQAEMKQLHADLKMTVLMVTHDLHEAFSMGTEIVIMNKGKILQKDKPAIVIEKPESEWVREFISGYSHN